MKYVVVIKKGYSEIKFKFSDYQVASSFAFGALAHACDDRAVTVELSVEGEAEEAVENKESEEN